MSGKLRINQYQATGKYPLNLLAYIFDLERIHPASEAQINELLVQVKNLRQMENAAIEAYFKLELSLSNTGIILGNKTQEAARQYIMKGKMRIRKGLHKSGLFSEYFEILEAPMKARLAQREKDKKEAMLTIQKECPIFLDWLQTQDYPVLSDERLISFAAYLNARTEQKKIVEQVYETLNEIDK